jgi:hypothetical protein
MSTQAEVPLTQSVRLRAAVTPMSFARVGVVGSPREPPAFINHFRVQPKDETLDGFLER